MRQVETTGLIGRGDELAEITRALAGARMVTLHGFGGMGKTRLAQRVTRDLAGSHAAGATMVDLADVLDPSLVGFAVADTLGLRPAGSGGQEQVLADHLATTELLLVLDNCEQVADACASLLGFLLDRCPELRVLATSRQPLGVPGERVILTSPLPLPPEPVATPVGEPGPRTGQRPDLGEVAAVALFVERARSVQPDFTLTPENTDAVARLCIALEGVPLALELAAARVRTLSPEAMVARLDDRFRLLGRGFSDAPLRQRSLEASVRWSHDLCTDQERLLWARLSVFSGGFEVDAVGAVCGGVELPVDRIPDLLRALQDRSVVTVDPDAPDATRFTMLEDVRAFGEHRLEESGESAWAFGRHREWVACLARRFEEQFYGPEQPALVARVRRDHRNLQRALRRAVDAGAAVEAVRTCVCLEGYWAVTGLLGEARHWLDEALAHDGIGALDRAGGLWVRGYFEGIQGALDRAQGTADELAALAEASPVPRVLGRQRFVVAMLAFFRTEAPAAVTACREALVLLERAGDDDLALLARFNLAMFLAHAGEPAESAALLAACRVETEERGELYLRSYCLWLEGVVAARSGDLTGAVALHRRGLDMKWRLRDQLGVALMLEALASCASSPGEELHAAALLGCAQRVWLTVGHAAVAGTYAAAQRDLGERLARGALEDRAFDAAYRTGLGLSQDEAVALALGGPLVLDPAEVSPAALSPRETEVARLVSEGRSDREIAADLVISVRTAQGHTQNVLRKLGLHSRSDVHARLTEVGR